VRRLAALAATALVAVGCGSKAAPVASPVDLVPANALAYVDVTAPVVPLAGRAPLARRLFGLPGGRFAVLRSGRVWFAQPRDPKTFVASLGPAYVHATVRGWVAWSHVQAALDAVVHARTRLADSVRYRAAAASLPGDAQVRVYLRPAATANFVDAPSALPPARTWAAVAIVERAGSLRVEVHANGATEPDTDTADLVRSVPADAIAAFAGNRAPDLTALDRLTAPLGLDLAPLVASVGTPVAGYVEAGAPMPVVAVRGRPRNPRAALKRVRRAVARLAAGHGTASELSLGGSTFRQVDFGPVALVYGLSDGDVVLSDDANAVTAAGGLHPPGLPERTQSWTYVDARRARIALAAFAQLGAPAPPELEKAIAGLGTLLAYRVRTGRLETVVASLETP
jgi:hypothetical protein